MESSNGTTSYCAKVDGLARWFGTGIAVAFFASLEQCSCINLNTDDEDGEEAKDRPLMLVAFNHSAYSTSEASNCYPSAVENLP